MAEDDIKDRPMNQHASWGIKEYALAGTAAAVLVVGGVVLYKGFNGITSRLDAQAARQVQAATVIYQPAAAATPVIVDNKDVANAILGLKDVLLAQKAQGNTQDPNVAQHIADLEKRIAELSKAPAAVTPVTTPVVVPVVTPVTPVVVEQPKAPAVAQPKMVYVFDVDGNGQLDSINMPVYDGKVKVFLNNEKDVEYNLDALRNSLFARFQSMNLTKEQKMNAISPYVSAYTSGQTNQGEEVLGFVMRTNTDAKSSQLENALQFAMLTDKVARANIVGDRLVKYFISQDKDKYVVSYDKDRATQHMDTLGTDRNNWAVAGNWILSSAIVDAIRHDGRVEREQNAVLESQLGSNMPVLVGTYNTAIPQGTVALEKTAQDLYSMQGNMYRNLFALQSMKLNKVGGNQ